MIVPVAVLVFDGHEGGCGRCVDAPGRAGDSAAVGVEILRRERQRGRGEELRLHVFGGELGALWVTAGSRRGDDSELNAVDVRER